MTIKSVPVITKDTVQAELEKLARFDDHALDLFNQLSAIEENLIPEPLAGQIFILLTSSRNKLLISVKDQEILQHTVVGFFGLSVGSHAVVSWTMLARPNSVKIVDPDIISPTNLNRLRTGWDSVGDNKIDAVAAEIIRLNPYINIEKTKNTDSQTTENLFAYSPQINVVVDSVDDLQAKVALRQLAKKYHLPVVMATDVGDNVILDIERYDTNPDQKLFNDRVKDIDHIDLDNLNPLQKIKLAIQIVGFEFLSDRMLQSLLVIGKEIPTWPQLGSTASMAGGAIATVIKKIVLNENVRSGRYPLFLDSLIDSDFQSDNRVEQRNVLIDEVKRQFEVDA